MINRRKREYIDEIVNVATDLFLQKGYVNTRMDEIAEAVGLTKGGLYYHIDKKEDLFLAMDKSVHSSLSQRIGEIDSENPDPLCKMARLLRALADNVSEKQRESTVFIREIRNIPEAALSSITERQKVVKKLFEDCIREGISEGKFRKDVDPHLSSLLILGMVNWVLLWYRADGRNSFEDIKQEIERMVFFGLIDQGAASKVGAEQHKQHPPS